MPHCRGLEAVSDLNQLAAQLEAGSASHTIRFLSAMLCPIYRTHLLRERTEHIIGFFFGPVASAALIFRSEAGWSDASSADVFDFGYLSLKGS